MKNNGKILKINIQNWNLAVKDWNFSLKSLDSATAPDLAV